MRFSVLADFVSGFAVLDEFFFGFAVSSIPQCPPQFAPVVWGSHVVLGEGALLMIPKRQPRAALAVFTDDN